jgi:hypothetical protein
LHRLNADAIVRLRQVSSHLLLPDTEPNGSDSEFHEVTDAAALKALKARSHPESCCRIALAQSTCPAR